MIHYDRVKIIIDAASVAQLFINIIVRYQRIFNLLIGDQGSVFMFKFWLSLYHFLSIKPRLSTVFHSLTDSQTKKQSSI